VNTLLLYPGSSLAATNSAASVVESKLKGNPNIRSVQIRSGRAAGDADAAGVNLAHVDVELSEKGMEDRPATVKMLRQAFDNIPGAAPNVGGFISHRMDEVLSGVRSAIAVKIFGSDLAQLRKLGQQVNAVMQSVPGIVDLQLEPQIPVEQVQIKFDRAAAARYGLTMKHIAEVVETALNGRVVSQVLEQQQTFDLVVWMVPAARQSLENMRNLSIDTPTGSKIPLAQVATIGTGTGPNQSITKMSRA
jgi:cation efflux system protein involved in nickel and cobalt tolerance